LKDGTEMVVKPLLAKVLAPLITAYEQAIQALALTLRSIIDVVSERPETLLKEITPTDGLLEQIDAGPLSQSQQTLRRLTTEDMAGFVPMLDKCNFQLFDIYLTIIDNIRVLSRNAVYTYTSLASAAMAASVDGPGQSPDRIASMKSYNSPPMTRQSVGRQSDDGSSPLSRHPSMTMQRSPSMINPLSKKRGSTLSPAILRPRLNDALNDTIDCLGDDAKENINKTLKDLFTDILEYSVQERISIPCAELAFQHAGKVPKNLVNIVSFPAIIDRYIRKLVDDELTAVLVHTEAEVAARIDEVVSRLRIITVA